MCSVGTAVQISLSALQLRSNRGKSVQLSDAHRQYPAGTLPVRFFSSTEDKRTTEPPPLSPIYFAISRKEG